MLERLPADLQRQPLLGIHQLRLARGDAEELGVETGQVVEEGAQAGHVAQHRGVARVTPQVRLPPLGGQLTDRAAALQQEAPQLGRCADAACQPASDADDRDGFGG